MEATSFKEVNCVFGPPPGMTEEQVHSLSVAKVDYDGQPAIVSCWKLTQQELDEFKRTGRIWFISMGESLAPHVLTANNPFEHNWAKPVDG